MMHLDDNASQLGSVDLVSILILAGLIKEWTLLWASK